MSENQSDEKTLPSAKNNAAESMPPSNSSAPSTSWSPGADLSAPTKDEAVERMKDPDDKEQQENPSQVSYKQQREAEGNRGASLSDCQEPSSHSESSAPVAQHSKQICNTDETSHLSPDNEFQASGSADANGSESQNDRASATDNLFDSKITTEYQSRDHHQAANYTAAKGRSGISAQFADGTNVVVRIRLQNTLVKGPPEYEEGINGHAEVNDFTSYGKSEGDTDWKKGFERSYSRSTNNSVDADNNQTFNHASGRNEVESSSSHGGSEDEGRTNHNHHHHHPRRGRSSSFDIREAESGLSSRDTSTSSSLPVNTAAAAAAGSGFAEASLLLGIAEGGTKTKEALGPGTLPTGMTSFLDALNDEQRRTRHRYIPTVEGFRKLYKSEIKSDLAVARLSGKKKKKTHERDNIEQARGDAMDIDDETSVISESDLLSDLAALKEKKAGEAFVFPSESNISLAINGRLASLMENTPFETKLSGKSLNSPHWVESLTAFNPPRPQESIGTKTKHRMKRWERHPKEVEDDLMMYRKTVQRTREELRKAQDEHHFIEAVGSMVRTHFMDHLVAFRQELDAINHELHGAQSECLKAAELYNTKSVTTRAAVGKSMKDVLSILKSVGVELERIMGEASENTESTEPGDDWRVSGIGGVRALADNDEKNMKDEVFLASGWILKGDRVITPSGEGEVISIIEPRLKDSVATLGGTNDANTVLPEQIEVRLASGVKLFNPSEIRLLIPQFCTRDSDLVIRWQNMKESASKMGFCHDYAGMDSRIHSLLLKQRCKEALREKEATETDSTNTDDKLTVDPVNRSGSPKSVTQHDDLRSMLPFGACFMNAPQTIGNYSSIIPLESLESNIRKSVYERLPIGSRNAAVIPVLPHDLKTFETQREELNSVKIEVMQLRNRLSRQKRVRSLNERSLAAGKNRSRKVEGLLSEMHMDLSNLKERLQAELRELGIGDFEEQPTVDSDDVDGQVSEKYIDNKVGVDSVMEGIKLSDNDQMKASSARGLTEENRTDLVEKAIPREFESKGSSPKLNEVRIETMKSEPKSQTKPFVADNIIQEEDDTEVSGMESDKHIGLCTESVDHVKAIESKTSEGCKTSNIKDDDDMEEVELKNDGNGDLSTNDNGHMKEIELKYFEGGKTDNKKINSMMEERELKNDEDKQISNNETKMDQVGAKSNANIIIDAYESTNCTDEAKENISNIPSEGKMPPPEHLKNENQSKIEEISANSIATQETTPKQSMTQPESNAEDYHIQNVSCSIGVSSSDGNRSAFPTTDSDSYSKNDEADSTKAVISTMDSGATEKRSSDVDDQERESKRQRL